MIHPSHRPRDRVGFDVAGGPGPTQRRPGVSFNRNSTADVVYAARSALSPGAIGRDAASLSFVRDPASRQ
jgi:hypothetical protein